MFLAPRVCESGVRVPSDPADRRAHAHTVHTRADVVKRGHAHIRTGPKASTEVLSPWSQGRVPTSKAPILLHLRTGRLRYRKIHTHLEHVPDTQTCHICARVTLHAEHSHARSRLHVPQHANTQAHTLTGISLLSTLGRSPPSRTLLWAVPRKSLGSWVMEVEDPGLAEPSAAPGTVWHSGLGQTWGPGPGLGREGVARGWTSSSWICLWASASSSSAPVSVRSRRPFSALSRTVSSWLRSFSRST